MMIHARRQDGRRSDRAIVARNSHRRRSVILVCALLMAACGSSKDCPAGARDCPCPSDGKCNVGLLCSADKTCHISPAEDNGDAPKEPVCYTPCHQGVTTADGKFLACSSEGLLRGCLDDAKCINGSCVPQRAAAVASAAPVDAGAAPEPVQAKKEVGKCERNIDCPDFQVCIGGSCYSNCEADGDCATGKVCYRKACRLRCDAATESCPDGTYCSLVDAVSGSCLPLADRPPVADKISTGAPAQEQAQGTFEVSQDIFKFSNTKLSNSFTVTNHSPVALEFVVSKLEHTEYKPDGQVQITVHALPWLKMGPQGEADKQDSFKILVDANGEVTVDMQNVGNEIPPKWDGSLKVSSSVLGERVLHLGYAQGADGRWAGTASYFAQFGDTNLDAWAAKRDDQAKLAKVGNAFVQKWGALRNGRISLDEFDAVMTATTSAAWNWPSVKEICPTAACYLYTNPEGYGRYSDSLDDQPVPTGVAQLPIALDLQQITPTQFQGKLVSSEALQYAGDPAVTLDFSTDPSDCASNNSSACLALVDTMSAKIVVGGHFATTSIDRNCSSMSGYALAKIPWLLPGFMRGTEIDASTKTPYAYECRDRVQPFGSADTTLTALNASLAGSNPIKDGRSRRRELQIVDGLLVNQAKLYLLLKETFDADFLGAGTASGFSAYSVAVLHRANAQLAGDAYAGTVQTDSRDTSVDLSKNITCSANLVQKALGAGGVLSNSNAESVVTTLLDGIKPNQSATTLPAAQVHYLCQVTGLFDQGPDLAAPAACPPGSGVTFFTGVPDSLAAQECQKTGACQSALNAWLGDPTRNVDIIDIYGCDTTDEVLCEKNRNDLRAHRIFYSPSDQTAVFSPLIDAINRAFRYKTQFANREGKAVGFAPEICVPNSSSTPYCYDPPAIEELRERVDCLNDLYRKSVGTRKTYALSEQTRARIFAFLVRAYSYDEIHDPLLPVPITHDGFEKLNAELLIMLGDEAYTDAFKARFDLANSALVSFEGSKFESGGIDLSGVAGFEMYTLYQANQYYQLALDRFFSLGPFVWDSVNGAPENNFIQQKMVVSYLDRIMRASTQKSRAWSEVAKRYESFSRPDLARFVIQRAFAAAYIESVSLSRLMLGLVAKVTPEQRAQIRKALENASLTYQSAFASMQEQYASISDQTGYFGFSPDYVPFPAIEPNGVNAFETLLSTAKQSMTVAAQKEDAAIAADRGFETDSASFQSELARIRNTYDDQLAQVCGTFVGTDGVVYPATDTYAPLNVKAKTLGEPCGMMGNGDIFQAIGDLESKKLDIDAAELAATNVFAEIATEQKRVDDLCKIVTDLAKFEFETAEKVDSIAANIARTKKTIADMKMTLEILQQVTTLMTCVAGVGGTDCPSKVAAALFWGVASSMLSAVASAAEDDILKQQDDIAALQRATITYKGAAECQQLQANSVATISNLNLKVSEIKLQALRAGYAVKLSAGNVQKLWNQSRRLLAEQQEAQQLTINAEAAKNDPNVRIYKNDAILNAERTFDDAVRSAYQTTRVFEYYASQSYSHKGDLSLVRLVSKGDQSLEGYLSALEHTYSQFAENHGRPDSRVDILSLRDDVLQIPRLSATGAALGESERVALFRAALGDPRLLDEHGYLTVPFSTNFVRLSPATRDHKISSVEAEILGSQVGDTIGRVYLRQAGTGAVSSLDDSKTYYRFPERTAVVNTFFNGIRVFTPDVYRNDHLRDRPYVNTRWEFVLNQRDEQANQDIRLSALTDIRLYIYYNDFVGL